MKEDDLLSGLGVRGHSDEEDPLVIGLAAAEELADGEFDPRELDGQLLVVLDADDLAD